MHFYDEGEVREVTEGFNILKVREIREEETHASEEHHRHVNWITVGKKKMKKIVGRAWKFGANVDTDRIIPAEYLVTGDAKELAKHAFEKARPRFAKEVKTGDVIIAAENFGCGSSREHAPRAFMGSGIACVVAKSFARIFFRNAINIGLPVVECDVKVRDGDDIEIDFVKGIIRNLADEKTYFFKPLPEFLLNLLNSGGLVKYTKKRLNLYV